MTEIRYIEGFYELWDELRRRHPRIWIDNCASGGRRIDLETLSRSLPLWPSDYCDMPGLRDGLGLHVGDQCMTVGLARWVPLMGGGMWNFEPYGARSQMIGGFTFGFHIPREAYATPEAMRVETFKDVLGRSPALMHEGFPMALARRAIREWKKLRPFFLGDLHLLLPLTASPHDWCAYQYHRPEDDAGIAMFFRRHRSPFPGMQVELRAIDREAEYEVSLSEGYAEAPPKLMRGAKLARLVVSIAARPGSLLLRYRRVARAHARANRRGT
jgi:alpha-galactosidase